MLLKQTIWSAVTAMSADNAFRSKRQITMRGAVWGLGHTITLFSICFVVIVLGVTLSEQLSSLFELAVGIMLVFLGVNVVLKLRKKRVHFHLHNHGQGKSHFHAHSHEKTEDNHEIDQHHHVHPEGFPFKALGIWFDPWCSRFCWASCIGYCCVSKPTGGD